MRKTIEQLLNEAGRNNYGYYDVTPGTNVLPHKESRDSTSFVGKTSPAKQNQAGPGGG